jgi:hypothetical protein
MLKYIEEENTPIPSGQNTPDVKCTKQQVIPGKLLKVVEQKDWESASSRSEDELSFKNQEIFEKPEGCKTTASELFQRNVTKPNGTNSSPTKNSNNLDHFITRQK